MTALLAFAVLLFWSGVVGYWLRMIRPMRVLFDWAETQLEGDGWDWWVRRYPAAVILCAALVLHPWKACRAWRDNRQRTLAGTEFTGAMRPAYDPDWTKTEEPKP